MFSRFRRAMSGRRDTSCFSRYYSRILLSGYDGVPTADEARIDLNARIAEQVRARSLIVGG